MFVNMERQEGEEQEEEATASDEEMQEIKAVQAVDECYVPFALVLEINPGLNLTQKNNVFINQA
jgi:hypothetical protein